MKSTKMRNFRELSEVNEQIKQIQEKDSGWRAFVEFKEIQDGEVVITIEYWYQLKSMIAPTARSIKAPRAIKKNSISKLLSSSRK